MLGHNGNLTNSDKLKEEMFRQDLRHINTNSDSEVLLNVLAHELEKASVKLRLDPQTIFTAVANVHRRVRGAYAVIAMIAGYGVLAFRDPYGIRPAVIGYNETADRHRVHGRLRDRRLDALGFRLLRDIAPGEAVFIDEDGNFYSQQCAERTVAQSLHLRVRLPGAAGFADRRRLGLRDAPAHGREAGREDQRASTGTSRSTW